MLRHLKELRMKRLLPALGLLCVVGAASAQLVVPPSTAKTFSGYDGEPALQTGLLDHGVQGMAKPVLS